jgi:hypothetical protein
LHTVYLAPIPAIMHCIIGRGAIGDLRYS